MVWCSRQDDRPVSRGPARQRGFTRPTDQDLLRQSGAKGLFFSVMRSYVVMAVYMEKIIST